MPAVAFAQAPATGGASGGSTPATATLVSAPTVGNQLLCLVAYSGYMGVPLPTPTGYTKVYDDFGLVATPGYNNALLQKTSAGAGDQSISVSPSNPFGICIYFCELTDAGTATGFLLSNTSTSQVLTDASAGDLVMFMGVANGGSAGGAAAGWNETYVLTGSGDANGDFQYYTRVPVTTTYQTTFTGAGANVIFSVPSTAPPTQGAHVTQEAIESLQIPGTANARITQEMLEALNVPLRTGVNARITQQTIETLMIPQRTITSSEARITQQAIEFLYIPGVFGPTGSGATEDFYYYQEGFTY